MPHEIQEKYSSIGIESKTIRLNQLKDTIILMLNTFYNSNNIYNVTIRATNSSNNFRDLTVNVTILNLDDISGL